MKTPTRTTALDYWAALVREDASLPLFEAAVAIAQDAYPDLDIGAAQAAADAMAAELRAAIKRSDSVETRIARLHERFFDGWQFRGAIADYGEPDNSYLHRVIERRRGIPISLSVLYMEICQQVGIAVDGIAFPGHFLVRHELPDGLIVIDVFAGGSSLSPDELAGRLRRYVEAGAPDAHQALPRYLQAAPSRAILTRMLRNLQVAFGARGDQRARAAVERRLAILLSKS